jgi:Flp pilus assembly protein TadD
VKLSTLNPIRAFNRLVSRPAKASGDASRRAALLLRASACIRLGDCDQAEMLLTSGLLEAKDAGRLNLLGVICEKRGRWNDARRFYGRSVRADRSYPPPRENIRRWFELDTFGRSRIPVAFGDEGPEWWCARHSAMNAPPRPAPLRLGPAASPQN